MRLSFRGTFGSCALVAGAWTSWSCSGSDSGTPVSESVDASTIAPTADANAAVPSDAPTGRCVEETYPVGACDHHPQYCRPASGYACCYCVPAHSSCGVPMAWICGDLYKDCPAAPPTPGSPCNMEFPNLGCTYCDPPLGAYGCRDGTWRKVVDELFCQSPLVHD